MVVTRLQEAKEGRRARVPVRCGFGWRGWWLLSHAWRAVWLRLVLRVKVVVDRRRHGRASELLQFGRRNEAAVPAIPKGAR